MKVEKAALVILVLGVGTLGRIALRLFDLSDHSVQADAGTEVRAAVRTPSAHHSTRSSLVPAGVPEVQPRALPAADLPTTTNIVKKESKPLDSFFQAQGRDAESLLAAYRVSGDPSLLSEAIARFPMNRSVLAEQALRGKTNQAKDQAIAALHEAEPDNVLPLHLAAARALENGDETRALNNILAADELIRTSGKFDDHSTDTVHRTLDAYRALGYSQFQAVMFVRAKARTDYQPQYVRLSKAVNDWTRSQAVMGNTVEMGKFREVGQRMFAPYIWTTQAPVKTNQDSPVRYEPVNWNALTTAKREAILLAAEVPITEVHYQTSSGAGMSTSNAQRIHPSQVVMPP